MHLFCGHWRHGRDARVEERLSPRIEEGIECKVRDEGPEALHTRDSEDETARCG